MKKHLCKIFMIPAVVFFVVGCMALSSYAEGKVTVTANSAYVRANASTSGQVVGGAMQNEVLDVLGTETDSDGNTWYKVQIKDGTVGYIRYDVVKSDSNDTPATTTTPDISSIATLEQTIPVECEPVGASVSDDVRVRGGASTSHRVVATAKTNTAVTVIGYAYSSDAYLWYQVNYSSTDGDVSGYIRSDFLKLEGEIVDKVEEPVVEEPEPEPVVEEPEPEPVYNDYEAVYSEAEDCWYLNNYVDGNRPKISELLSAKKDFDELTAYSEKTIKSKNIAIVVLAVIIVVLIGVGVYAYISVRRWYYGSDEETEEPVHNYSKAPDRREYKPSSDSRKVQTERQTAASSRSSNIMSQTIGPEKKTVNEEFRMPKPPANPAPIKKSPLEGAVRLPDGRIQMPDGSIRKAVLAVKLPDGSIKYEDGTIKKPDGTIIKPSAPKQAVDTESIKPEPQVRRGSTMVETKEVPYHRTVESSADDDMEYGFLDLDK